MLSEALDRPWLVFACRVPMWDCTEDMMMNTSSQKQFQAKNSQNFKTSQST